MSFRVAVNALKDSRPFRNRSIRQLWDMVERHAATIPNGEPWIEVGETEREVGVGGALIVIEGTVVVRTVTPAHDHLEGHPLPLPPPPEPVVETLSQGTVRFSPDTGRTESTFFARAGGRPARVMVIPSELVGHLDPERMPVTFTVTFTAKDGTIVRKTYYAVTAPKDRLHTVLLSEDQGSGAPLEALAQLAAVALSTTFQESAAVLVCRDPALDLLLWEGKSFTKVPLAAPADEKDVIAALKARDGQAFHHLIVTHPSNAQSRPAEIAPLEFDRIAYVTNAIGDTVPKAIRPYLKAWVQNATKPGDPYFSSFVPTLLGKSWPGPTTGAFSEPVNDDVPSLAQLVSKPGWRQRRDACRLDWGAGTIAAEWASWNASGAKDAFPLTVFARSQDRETGARWARALTNRRVGVAISGGGTACARAITFLEALQPSGATNLHVPVDVVSGVSGGALVAAYYCHSGDRGLACCKENGLLYGAMAVGGFVWSEVIRLVIDLHLGDRRLEDVSVRFVPLTTVSVRAGVPATHAVVHGTFGEAVQVSGSLPPGLAPTARDGARYLDGATSAPLPARALREYGADIVFAVNTVGGPSDGNPWQYSSLGRFAYEHTLAGRFIDAWIAAAFLLQRVTSEMGEDAHESYVAGATRFPLIECVKYWGFRGIADEARRSMQLSQAIARCRDRWREISGTPPVTN